MIRLWPIWTCFWIISSINAQNQGSQRPNFQEDIAPIVFTKCTPCHRPNAIGPMSFTNYKEVAAYARMIAYVTEANYMPPWPADPNYRHFSDEVQLSEGEIALIKNWVIAGLPEGKTSPKISPDFPTGPQIEKPDLQISMAESFEQYGIYYDQFQTFVLQTGLEHDQEISAIEFVPGNPKIVRHCRVAIDRGAAAEKEDAWDPRYGYFSYGGWGFVPEQSEWYTWTTGEGPLHFPQGKGKILPAGAKLIVQVHYGPTGIKQRDSSYFNFVFAKQKLEQSIQTVPLLNPYTLKNPPFHIPAGEVKRFFSSVQLPYAIDLYDITPHSLLLAKKWEIYAKVPGQRLPVKLLKIKDWDYKWKRSYRLPQPIHLPKGTTIHALVEYDNTANNPYNPVSPPINVTWGKRIYQEMLLVHFGFTAMEEEQQGTKDFYFVDLLANQVTEKKTIRFFTAKAADFSVEILNTAAERIRMSLDRQSFDPGQHLVSISLGGLPYGVYAIRLINESTGQSRQQMLVYFGEEIL